MARLKKVGTMRNVNKSDEKPVIGILGGVGSGKSTVAAELGRLGCRVISADKIVHKVLEKKSIRDKIVHSFGETVLDSRGRIDRRKLAGAAFTAKERISELNSIVHPVVLALCEGLIRSYKAEKDCQAIVLDMPLLVEVGWDKRCNRLLFVDCNRSLRYKRAQKKGEFSLKELQLREDFQISLDKKASLSDNKIDNNSDLSSLANQVAQFFAGIVEN